MALIATLLLALPGLGRATTVAVNTDEVTRARPAPSTSAPRSPMPTTRTSRARPIALLEPALTP